MTISDYFSKLRDLWDGFDALMPCPGCPCPESKKYVQGNFKQRRSQVQCDCHYKGHTKENCYKLIGYPADFKPKKKGGTPGLHSNHANAEVYQPGEGHQMQVGAQHGRGDHSVVSQPVIMPQCPMMPQSTTYSHPSPLAPISHSNIISRLFNCSIRVLRRHHLQRLQDLYSGQVLGIGKEEYGLYLLKGNSLQKSVQLLNKCAHTTNLSSESISFESIHLWHLRLGHSPIDVIRRNDAPRNTFSTTVKTLWTDNGSEFFSAEFKALISSLEIIHQSSCVYTLQQNGVVERKHRTILEMARSLRVFGCLCYASNPKENDKFAPRALHAVLPGYSSGYKLYSLYTKSLFVSTHAVFQEHLFPFKHMKDTSTPIFSVLDLLPFAEAYLQVVPSHPYVPCQELHPITPFVPNEQQQHIASSPHAESPTSPLEPQDQPSELPPIQELRRSTREGKQLAWIQDYFLLPRTILAYILSPPMFLMLISNCLTSRPCQHIQLSESLIHSERLLWIQNVLRQ
ncbi:PREDICTED: uncharacterized protein LOC109217696 [Nicotiana attenuata]|uniref:uncharacterized protein LOC109217696 n=1 Tax=Nicotiana attenuata TaxID=49451 RepID=UPI000905A282|nr:PREDICTED: uncharacterized protein LOC109217696 [Nicotiana attenuata]